MHVITVTCVHVMSVGGDGSMCSGHVGSKSIIVFCSNIHVPLCSIQHLSRPSGLSWCDIISQKTWILWATIPEAKSNWSSLEQVASRHKWIAASTPWAWLVNTWQRRPCSLQDTKLEQTGQRWHPFYTDMDAMWTSSKRLPFWNLVHWSTYIDFHVELLLTGALALTFSLGLFTGANLQQARANGGVDVMRVISEHSTCSGHVEWAHRAEVTSLSVPKLLHLLHARKNLRCRQATQRIVTALFNIFVIVRCNCVALQPVTKHAI